MIDKVIILSRKINAVSEGAENLYYRIYVNTDDFGLFHADPEILKGQIYTLRKDVSVEIIENRLKELTEIELIKLYKHNGESYLEIVDFEKHQTFRKDYVKKYDYPKPDTNSYKVVQTRTKSPTNINEIKLKETKLKEDKECNYILKFLSEVKNYPYNEKRDLGFIKGLIADFPDLDALEEIKKKCAWWLSNPILKSSNPHLQLRNWFLKARQFLKEGDKSRDVGKSYIKEDEFLPMEVLNKAYKIILKRNGDISVFYNHAKSAFPKIKAQWEKSDKKPETFIKLVEECDKCNKNVK